MGGSAISWETVEVFGVRGMAEVAGSALRSAGIPFRIMADDGGAALQLPFSLRTRGAELQVPAEDVEDARALLAGEGLELDILDMAEAQGVEPVPALDGEAALRRQPMIAIGRLLLALALVGLVITLLGDVI